MQRLTIKSTEASQRQFETESLRTFESHANKSGTADFCRNAVPDARPDYFDCRPEAAFAGFWRRMDWRRR